MNREAAIQIAASHIKKWEGLASTRPDKNTYVSNPESAPANTILHPYPDGKSYSIGWGSYNKLSDGTSVVRGLTITKERADKELEYEVRQIDKTIFPKITNTKLTETQYAALLDTAYNAGPGSLSYSSNGRGESFPSLLSLVNAGKDTTATFPKVAITDSRTGKVLNSLIDRRKDAAELWLGNYDTIYQRFLRFTGKNPNAVNYSVIGAVLLGIGGYLYYLKRKGIIFK
jgi:GH24 family phage-related lysozyme (muramidase)